MLRHVTVKFLETLVYLNNEYKNQDSQIAMYLDFTCKVIAQHKEGILIEYLKRHPLGAYALGNNGTLPELTDLQMKILNGVLEGKKVKEIAQELKVTPRWVSKNRTYIEQKLGKDLNHWVGYQFVKWKAPKT